MTPPVVLLHGFTGAPASWSRVRATLETDTRSGPILAPAAIGHDGTAGPPDIVAFEDEVDRLAAWVTERTSGPVQLAGYSMGGRLALGLLVRHPALVSAATLIGTSPGLPSAAERVERARSDERWARLLETEGLDTFVAAWEALPIFESQAALDPAVLEAQRRIRRSHDAAGLARSLRVIGLSRMPDYRSSLDAIRCPIRLVVGERDAKFRALAAEMRERLPRATVHVVPDVGHNVVLARPSVIAELITEGDE